MPYSQEALLALKVKIKQTKFNLQRLKEHILIKRENLTMLPTPSPDGCHLIMTKINKIEEKLVAKEAEAKLEPLEHSSQFETLRNSSEVLLSKYHNMDSQLSDIR